MQAKVPKCERILITQQHIYYILFGSKEEFEKSTDIFESAWPEKGSHMVLYDFRHPDDGAVNITDKKLSGDMIDKSKKITKKQYDDYLVKIKNYKLSSDKQAELERFILDAVEDQIERIIQNINKYMSDTEEELQKQETILKVRRNILAGKEETDKTWIEQQCINDILKNNIKQYMDLIPKINEYLSGNKAELIKNEDFINQIETLLTIDDAEEIFKQARMQAQVEQIKQAHKNNENAYDLLITTTSTTVQGSQNSTNPPTTFMQIEEEKKSAQKKPKGKRR
jgi:hypothetical protein